MPFTTSEFQLRSSPDNLKYTTKALLLECPKQSYRLIWLELQFGISGFAVGGSSVFNSSEAVLCSAYLASWKGAELCGFLYLSFGICNPSPLKHMHETIRAGLQFSSLGLRAMGAFINCRPSNPSVLREDVGRPNASAMHSRLRLLRLILHERRLPTL